MVLYIIPGNTDLFSLVGVDVHIKVQLVFIFFCRSRQVGIRKGKSCVPFPLYLVFNMAATAYV